MVTELTGGALVPLFDLDKFGARGFVRGIGAGAPLEGAVFVAVLDGWRGRLGLVAPMAGSFRGWSRDSSSSSIVDLRFRLFVEANANDGPVSIAGDELRSRGSLDITVDSN